MKAEALNLLPQKKSNLLEILPRRHTWSRRRPGYPSSRPDARCNSHPAPSSGDSTTSSRNQILQRQLQPPNRQKIREDSHSAAFSGPGSHLRQPPLNKALDFTERTKFLSKSSSETLTSLRMKGFRARFHRSSFSGGRFDAGLCETHKIPCDKRDFH